MVLARISRYGRSVGLMFQIVDDLLDVEQTSEHAGKRTGKDAAAGKLTFPGVLGVARSRQEVGKLRESALAELTPLGPAAGGLRNLTEYLATRTR